MVRLRIKLATGVVLAAGLVPMAAAAPAGASSQAITATPAPLGQPETVSFMMAHGNNYSPGQPNPVAGNQIVQTTSPGRIFTFSNNVMVGSDHGGTLELANGNFMAANDACTGVTIKSNSGSNGTVWYIIPNPTTGTIQLASRYCMDPLDQDPLIIYGDDTLNHQWQFCEAGPGEDSCGTGEFYNLLETQYV
jgi:hypothetical protein